MLQNLAKSCLFLAFGSLIAPAASGQGWGGQGATSAFGGGGFGTSGFGNAGFGASRFGGSGMGGFGVSGFGNAGFGASRFGTSGFNGGFGGGGWGGGSGFGGSVFGNQSFGNGGYGGGSNFVGRDSGDMAATFNQMGRAGTQFLNQMTRTLRRSSRDSQPEASVESVPQPLRVKLEVAFAAPQPAPSVVAARLQTRLDKILSDHGIDQPIVTMEGDTAVISGVAASESQRLVLEKLVMLEPGVRQVRNEMIVSAPAAEAMPAEPLSSEATRPVADN